MYKSAAFSYFSVLPPKKLNPPPALESVESACVGSVSIGLNEKHVLERRGGHFVPFAAGLADPAPFSLFVITQVSICFGNERRDQLVTTKFETSR